MDEVALAGGYGTAGVARVGDTVRRPLGANATFVHTLLRQLEAAGFGGAPRLLGVDERGREILSFVEGEVVHDSETPLSEVRLASAGRLIREFHDATAGSALAGAAEVVCHGELGPHNTVFVGDDAIALIDFDTAAPGPRLHDLDHAAWFFAEVGAAGGALRDHSRRVRLLCDGYGWSDPAAVIDELEARFRRVLAEREAAGHEAGARVFAAKVEWMVENGPALRAAL